MRRFDDVRGTRKTGASPPFRVLTTRDSSYLGSSSSSSSIIPQPRSTTSPKIQLPAQPPTPPPPTAPEPYKLVPAGTALGRAHRRSSFVIIAESRPATPESRSVSPTQPPGRVSPFRGRGFKGPPPRSRPDSPDDYLDLRRSHRRNVRNDSRASQQSSPRKSLIPQPTRRRSVSLSKTTDDRVSPNIGRRGDKKNWLSVHGSIDNINEGRRNNLLNDSSRSRRDRAVIRTPSKLSPIRGTPTKVDKSNIRATSTRDPKNVKNLQRNTTTMVTPVSRFISPPKNNQKRERFITTDDNVTSSKISRIPLKNNGSKVSSSVSMPEMSRNKEINDNEKNGQTEGTINVNNNERTGNGNVNNQIGLADLLKRTSGVTGTSSVVNTTTTTAVQPLRIDNSRIPIDVTKIEGQFVDVSRKSESSFSKNGDTNGKSRLLSGQNHDDKNTRKRNAVYSTPTKTNNERYSTTNKEGASDSSGNSNNAIKSRLNSARTNRGYNRTTSRERFDVSKENDSASSKGSIMRNSKNPKSNKRSNFVDELSPVSNNSMLEYGTNEIDIVQITDSDKNINDGKSITSNDVIVTNTIGGTINNKTIADGNSSSSRSNKVIGNRVITEATVETETRQNVIDQGQNVLVSSNETERISGTMSSLKTNAKGNEIITNTMTTTTTTTTMSRTNGISVNSIGDSGAIGNVPLKTIHTRNNENQGNGNTPKRSLTQLSTGSNDSERSTDTGVSVDTVKGVSSPRVKRGMHVVKRPDEIETLSGNVMRPEQNGEPTALQTAGELTSEEDRPSADKPLSRWRRTLGRYYERFPSMKCLACRRNSKILSWSRKRETVAMGNETETRHDVADEIPIDCWSRFKKRCRCPRPKGIRCCARRDRVAPDEPNICFPPERRLSALCQRLFASCKCKCADVQRTRDIRAKPSLTSVAPPPLSEVILMFQDDILYLIIGAKGQDTRRFGGAQLFDARCHSLYASSTSLVLSYMERLATWYRHSLERTI
ncbi:probable cyclin-dependent serine/threonine-protein kinase DDB_G0292550 isoform X2 [Vespula pensylvanica]|uniref:probable cyclin-dependent serine/threonine-protein kinase DDB_G0292550 isoform X2 n=1 Tax=Vespula pensylvanica TaxID=30213 RepID=UPI001CB9FA78|nr:probable cyclin-dependent serine/threonine-protein kinase DDB_G0292550 isoform X2 [Vespula pensylvanica]